MNTGVTASVVSSVVGVMIFFLLVRSGANRPALRDAATGDLVLQCNGVLTWTMGVIALVGPLGMAILSFVIPFKNEREVYVPVAIGAFFLLLGGGLCLWCLRRRTRIGDRGVTSEYVFAKPRFLAWDDVVKVSMSGGQEFVLHGRDRRKTVVYVLFFTGVAEGVSRLVPNLPKSVRKECRADIDRLVKAAGAEV